MYLRTVSKYKPPERLFIIGDFFATRIYGACNPGDCKNGRANMRNFAVKLVSSAEEYVRSIHNWAECTADWFKKWSDSFQPIKK